MRIFFTHQPFLFETFSSSVSFVPQEFDNFCLKNLRPKRGLGNVLERLSQASGTFLIAANRIGGL